MSRSDHRVFVVVALTLGAALAAPAGGSAATTFPWRGTPVCAGSSAPTLALPARLTGAAVTYTVRARRSRLLGFTYDSFDRRGRNLGHGGPNILGSDTYAGSIPRFGPTEVRWVISAVAVFGKGRRACRAGAVRIITTRGAPQLWRCARRGAPYNRTLRCPLVRAR
jgi:hypothetical protein